MADPVPEGLLELLLGLGRLLLLSLRDAHLVSLVFITQSKVGA